MSEMKKNLVVILSCALIVWSVALGAASYQNHKDAQALLESK